jgi:hypothetical protein
MIPRLRRPPSQNWKTFLRNHLSSMVSVTEKRCWVEPSTADSSIRPRLGKARPTGPGPAASGVGTWISGSARAVGVARPESPRASSDGISARQRLGEARESANESCRGGFREIRQKPSVFSPDEILDSDTALILGFSPWWRQGAKWVCLGFALISAYLVMDSYRGNQPLPWNPVVLFFPLAMSLTGLLLSWKGRNARPW